MADFTRMSFAQEFDGYWMGQEQLDGLPTVILNSEFNRKSDPLIAKQMDDLDKSESQRRGETSGVYTTQLAEPLTFVPQNSNDPKAVKDTVIDSADRPIDAAEARFEQAMANAADVQPAATPAIGQGPSVSATTASPSASPDTSFGPSR